MPQHPGPSEDIQFQAQDLENLTGKSITKYYTDFDVILLTASTDISDRASPTKDNKMTFADTKEVPSNGSMQGSLNQEKGGRLSEWWNPFILNRLILVTFTMVFALILLAMGLLYHFAELDNGISTQISRNHYSWKYGPTACKLTNTTSSSFYYKTY